MPQRGVVNRGVSVHDLVERGLVPVGVTHLQANRALSDEHLLVVRQQFQLGRERVRASLIQNRSSRVHQQLKCRQPLLAVDDVIGQHGSRDGFLCLDDHGT